MKITAPMICGHRNQCRMSGCSSTMRLRLRVPLSRTMPSTDIVSGTSNASSWAIARIPPIIAYLLLELQPAMNSDGNVRLVMAKR